MRRTAVDTNVLVRILISEPSEQGRAAEALLASSTLYVPMTVVLESEWVMRRIMRIEKFRIIEMLSAMLKLKKIRVENPDALEAALVAARAGMDFADALHVANLDPRDKFYTFDKRLVRSARKFMTDVDVELLA